MNEAPIKAYYAIIPANVRYDEKLTPNAKLLYGEITALCNDKGYCWASNDYFASLYGVTKTSASKWISSLEKKGYISISMKYKEGTKEILYRYISLVKDPIEEKLHTPIEEKLKDNNTLTNNTFNITNKTLMSSIKIDDVPSEMKMYFEIAEAFRLLFIKNLKENGATTKDQKNAKYIAYVNQVKLMFTKDEATKEQFQKVFKFLGSSEGNFWKANILSIKKLREKFPKLIMDASKFKPKQKMINRQTEKEISNTGNAFLRAFTETNY